MANQKSVSGNAKYHIGINGKPAKCNAYKRGCPRGGENEHYDSVEAAEMAYHARKSVEVLKSSKSKSKRTTQRNSNVSYSADKEKLYVFGKPYTEASAASMLAARNNTREFIDARADKDVAMEYDKPARVRSARRRLKQLTDYAMVRGSTEMMDKLKNTMLADTGDFGTKNGERITAKETVAISTNLKTWDDSRKKAEMKLAAIAQNPAIADGKKKYEGVTVTVKSGQVDDNYYENLPQDVRDKISDTSQAPDMEAARAHLSPERFAELTRTEQVAEVVDGDMANRGDINPPKLETTKTKPQERFDDVAKQYGFFVRNAQYTVGSKSELTNKRKEYTNVIKEQHLKDRDDTGHTGPILYGGGKGSEGVLMSTRERFDREALGSLTDEERAQISRPKQR